MPTDFLSYVVSPFLLRGALLAIEISVLAMAFGLVLGLGLALMRLSSVPPYRWIATVYIEFFRGVPALLVFLAFGFGVPIAFHIDGEYLGETESVAFRFVPDALCVIA